jgi:16S rRNA (guanine527-N7)-methyltransferase
LRVADLGSGAGFPGIPIKLWAPDIALTLIESNQKKATFLREVTRALRFTDVNIKNLRAETISTASFDVVTLRAVERFAKAVPVGMSLVADRGRLALLISSAQLPAAYATVPAQSWEEPLPIPQSDSRVLLISRQRRIGAPEYS